MIGFTTLDTTLVTLDSTTAFTWDEDAPAQAGFVNILDSTNSWSFLVGNARPESIEFDRQLQRNPFGSSWFQSGSGTIGPQLVRVTGEVFSDAANGITSAVALVEDVRVAAEDAVLLRVTWADFEVLALQSFARTPIEAGYRVDMVFVTASGRL